MSQGGKAPDSVHGRKKNKMKRSGKNSDNTNKPSNDTPDPCNIFCEPCNNVLGNQIPVEMFCTNCCEYLCKSCSDYHTKLAATKQHILQDKESMPNDKSKVKDTSLEKCCLHSDNVIEYFCRSCDETGCHACITLDHRTCTNVDYISHIAIEFKRTEWWTFNETLDQITTELKFAEDKLKSNENKKDLLKEMARKAVKQQKDQVVSILDDWEHGMLKVIEEKDKGYEDKLKSISKQHNKLTSELQSMTSDLKQKDQNRDLCQLFIATKKGQKILAKLRNECQHLQTENKIPSYKFAPSKQVSARLTNSDTFGTLTRLHSEQKRMVEFRKAISVKSNQDEGLHCVSSVCVISTNLLIAVDRMFLKAINTNTDSTVFTLAVPKMPVSITKTSDKEIAVTINYEKKVIFLSVTGSGILTLEREFGVNGDCMGIAHLNRNLILTFHRPGKVEIVDMEGRVLKSFRRDMDEYKILQRPSNVVVGRCINRDVFYVSDTMNDTVTCMTLDGRIIAIYTDEQLREPWEMAVDENGSVFVCCGLSVDIHQLSEDCVKVQVVRDWGPGPSCSLDYCKQSKKLYIGKLTRAIINRFDIL